MSDQPLTDQASFLWNRQKNDYFHISKCHSLNILASELKLVSFLLKQILLELEWNSVWHHMYTVSKDNLSEAFLNIRKKI